MNDQLHAPALDPVATSAAIGTEVTTDAANVADGRDRGRADVTIGASPKNIDGVAKIDYAITREVLRPIPDCIVGRCAYSEQQVTIQSS
jgi:hypothetical protein